MTEQQAMLQSEAMHLGGGARGGEDRGTGGQGGSQGLRTNELQSVIGGWAAQYVTRVARRD